MNFNRNGNTRTASIDEPLTPVGDTLAGRAIFAIAASVFVGICARCTLPLPFTPVPLTLGNMAVLMVGLLLGPETAFSALALYLAEGACGLPVFTPTGPGGIAQILGPTGGYLVSYPFAAALASLAVRRFKMPFSRFGTAVAGCVLASLAIFTFGTAWLATLLHLNATAALRMAVLPFLPGEGLKIAAAAGIYSSVERWKRR